VITEPESSAGIKLPGKAQKSKIGITSPGLTNTKQKTAEAERRMALTHLKRVVVRNQ